MTWTLEYPGTALVMGDGANGIALAHAPQVLAVEIATDDRPRPRSDGTVVGRDFHVGRIVRMPLSCVGDDLAGVEDARDRLLHAWRADAVRNIPGMLARLTSERGRVAFGRPREISSDDDDDQFGIARVTADFLMVDPSWYGTVDSVTVPFSQPPSGGVRVPFKVPFRISGTGSGERVAAVAGDVATPLTVKFRGPILSPRLEVAGMLIELTGAIAYDEVVTVDARARTVTSSLGGSRAGMLTPRSTRLSSLQLPPGEHALVLRGTSESGTASAVVSWRDAFASY